MEREMLRKKQPLEIDIDAVGAVILAAQKENGEIPWNIGGKTDPWDHVEAAMGLAIAGHVDAAQKAYQWLAENQLEDGSWYAAYQDGAPIDRTRDTNMTTYVAVGVFHHFLLTGNTGFLKTMWPVVEKAIDFAAGMQAPTGEIYWAKSPDLKVDPMALLTGSSSIFMSMKCALAIARQIGVDRPDWKRAALKLKKAIKHGYHLFNITKSHYSMDWFYPVLTGALTGEDAKKRIDQHWKKFIVEGMGALCVSNRPWVTIAETSELVIALAAAGNHNVGEIVFNWLLDRKFDDGSYWCGFTYPDMVIWPEDKITWTNGVVIMAADALYHLTPASGLFSHEYWEKSNILDETPDGKSRRL
jgi:hypothetical protein